MEHVASSISLSNNEDYIARYFSLCKLYCDRASALTENASVMPLKRDELPEQSRLDAINERLALEKQLFTESLRNSLTSGKTFFLEDMAACCGLDEIERLIVALLLFMKYERPETSPLTRYEILRMLDLEGNAFNRLRWNRYFWKDSPLVRYKLIEFHSECYHRGADEIKYWLNPRMVELFSRAVNGEVIHWPQQIESQQTPDVFCDAVGFIKTPVHTFNDVVLKASTKEEVLTALDCLKGSLLKELGIAEVMKKGNGTLLLFYGPPGTGKSILAEAVAAYLGKNMLIAEYSKILNRWVGDTDKSIANLFKAAKLADLVLVLDEADSLLCDRQLAAQDHDIRFVNGLLQELERFEGVVILTTNLPHMLDPALERRVSLKIELDLPDPTMRKQLWQQHIPPGVTLSDNVSFQQLAQRYIFSGGNIRNAVMNALRKYVRQKSDILEMGHLIAGADLESNGMISSKSHRSVLGFTA